MKAHRGLSESSFVFALCTAMTWLTRIQGYAQDAVSFQLPKQELTQILEQNVPSGEEREGAWEEVGSNAVGKLGIKTKWQRSSITLKGTGNKIIVQTEISYRIKGAERIRNGVFVGGYSWYELGSCGYGERMRRMNVGMEVEVGVGSDSILSAHTHAASVQALDRCQITKLNIDVTGRLRDRVQKAIDAQAANLDSKLQELLKRQNNLGAEVRALREKVGPCRVTFLDDGSNITVNIAAGAVLEQPGNVGFIPCVHRVPCAHMGPCVHSMHPFDTLHPYDILRAGVFVACIHRMPCGHRLHPGDAIHPFDLLHEHD
jgi:hypothetical protein